MPLTTLRSLADCSSVGRQLCAAVGGGDVVDDFSAERAGEAEDVSFARDGSVTVQRMRERPWGELPRAGASVQLFVSSVTNGKGCPLPGVSCPQVLKAVLGDGDLCDALEAAVYMLKAAETATVRSTRPDWCVEQQLGLHDVSDNEVLFDVKLLSFTQAPDCLTMSPAQRFEFAETRFAAASSLHDRKRWASACLGYKCVREVLLLDAAEAFGPDQAPHAENLASVSRINWQACMVRYYRETGELKVRREQQRTGNRRIKVCTGATCSNAGAKAVIAEIEELVAATENGSSRCTVESAPCLNMCGRGPNAVVSEVDAECRETETQFTGLDSVQRSAVVVEYASQERAPLEDSQQLQRMARRRAYSAATAAYRGPKWNRALKLLRIAEDEAEEAGEDSEMRKELLYKQAVILEHVGAYEQAIRRMDKLAAISGEESDDLIQSRLQLVKKIARDNDPFALFAMGRVPDPDVHSSGRDVKWYARWKLEEVKPVTRWSSLFRFSCDEAERGDGDRNWQIWHRTLMAEVGPNAEGPMPWVEREYTPVHEEKHGNTTTATILVKIKPTGMATRWLHNLPVGSDVFFSKPQTSLMVPSMVSTDRLTEAFVPRSLLFIVGGTGLAPVLQYLDRLDSQVPITIVFCCNADDMFFLGKLQDYVSSWKRKMLVMDRLAVLAKVRQERVKAIVAVSDGASDQQAPNADFEHVPPARTGEIVSRAARDYPDVEFLEGRITQDVVTKAVGTMGAEGLRATVSGPPAMNDSVNRMLMAAGVARKQVTIMKAAA